MRGRFGLAATMTAVAAVLCAGCAPAGSAGAGHSPPSPAPYPAGTGSAPSGGAESLWAVAALGESDAWAVGTHDPLPRGIYPLTEHWDGQRWSAVPEPGGFRRASPQQLGSGGHRRARRRLGGGPVVAYRTCSALVRADRALERR